MMQALFLALALCQAAQPDVVVIVMDDASFSAVASGPRPNIVELAKQGYVFTNAHAMPLCSPTRRTLLTGRYHLEGQTEQVCATAGSQAIPTGTDFLPALLPGYDCGIFGKWHASSNPSGPWQLAPQARGFSTWRAGLAINVENCGGDTYQHWQRIDDGVTQEVFNSYQPAQTVQAFLAWWEATPSPKLAVVAPQLAHRPFHRPPASLLPPGYPATPDNASKYEAMLVAADAQVGTIMAAIDLQTTVVVLLGDNGAPVEVGGAKGTSLEGGTHVPLVMAGVGIPHGSSNAVVHVVDIPATLAGHDIGDGVDLHPLMAGAIAVHDFILCGQLADSLWPLDVCARGVRWKLRRTAAGDELYDLLNDPGESVNLIADPTKAAKVAQMTAWLEARIP